MKKISFKRIYKTALICGLITVSSCKNAFDVKPSGAVDATNAYQNVYDANSAVIGIYGQFLGLADRYIVLNELRADLVSPTANADVYLNQLNTHSETTDNPWADPKPWFKVILSINDAMYHFDDMLKTGKLKPVDYQQRYSDLGVLRAFLYLQVAAQYGTVPYITDPLSNISDLNDATKFPRLTIDQLLPKLAAFVNDPARNLENYAGTDPITGSTAGALLTAVTDGAAYYGGAGAGNSQYYFVPKYIIAGDINLWAGNYNQASIDYKYLMEYGAQRGGYTDAAQSKYTQFKVTGSDFAIVYDQNGVLTDSNIGGTTNNYREIFGMTSGSPTNTADEFHWRIPFNPADNIDPLIDLFANNGSGKYLLAPSQAIINNFNSQVQTNGYNFDGRSKVAIRTINAQPVIAKHIYYYLDPNTFQPINPIQKLGVWLIYRTSALQNHFAESALNDGQNRVAYSLYDRGIQRMFNPLSPNVPGGTVDITNTEQSFLPPPYDFDARSGGPQGYHFDWYREIGTRTRAGLVSSPLSLMNDKIGLENAIIDENARELCFEGYRWTDLVRIARRRGDPAFLADKIYNKLVLEGNPAAAAVRAKLMDPNGWYMPFKL